MLKITNLYKKYKGFEVLRGLNMNLEKGDVYGFLGKNGCGKTTTMNIICNIIAKDSGKIEFASSRRKIGYLTESPAMYAYMNGYEYLRYIAACANYDGDVETRIMDVLTVTDMVEGAKRRIKGYSRGMNQRLGIAAAMFDKPELLILDEPTSALDPEGRAAVVSIINSLKQTGVTIILCTHIISDVERVADKVGIMKDGLILEEGSIDTLIQKYSAQKGDSKTVVVKLAAPNSEEAAFLRELPNVNASEYNENNGEIRLNAENEELAGTLYDEAIALIAEKKIKIAQITTSQNMTLEDVYFAVTGMRGTA